MKTLLYTLVLFTSLGSCRKLEKMVERGEYDRAIVYATEKLAGKKNKKTKHIQSLQEAFLKINQKDLNHIAYLNGPSNPEKWEEILTIADKIQRRQDRIAPFLPLISKDGYVGHFDMVDAYAIKTTARDGAAAFYHAEGKSLLEMSKTEGNKFFARNAFDLLQKAGAIKENYSDSRLLMLEAKELGKVYIQVVVENKSLGYVPEDLERNLLSMNLSKADSRWRKHYLGKTENIEPDYQAVLELSEIQISPERESIREHTDEKRVKDGWTYKKGPKGKVLKDSSGNKIKVDKFKKVRAYVTEIHRQKSTQVNGQLKLIDLTNSALRSSRPLVVEAYFEDWASTFTGDRRAVCDKDHNRLKNIPISFPHDFDMILDASGKLKEAFIDELYEIHI